MLGVANDPSTVEVLADLAQVVVGVGAIVSIWIGLASLREVRRERAQRVRPWLAFDHGGQFIRCENSSTNGLPGIEPAFIQRVAGPATESAQTHLHVGKTPKSWWWSCARCPDHLCYQDCNCRNGDFPNRTGQVRRVSIRPARKSYSRLTLPRSSGRGSEISPGTRTYLRVRWRSSGDNWIDCNSVSRCS